MYNFFTPHAISIEELKEQGELSDEILNYCLQHDLRDIDSILKFCISASTAGIFEKATHETRNSLYRLCHRYIGGIENIILDDSIRRVAVIENMSQRSLNICISAGLLTLRDLLKYRLLKSDFKKLRNCGFVSNAELLFICRKYNDLFVQEELYKPSLINDNERPSQEVVEIQLTDNIDLRTLCTLEKMSVRAKKTCIRRNLYSLKSILEFYTNPKNQFLEIKNCGVTTNAELVRICEKYKGSITDVKNMDTNGSTSQFSPLDLFIGSLKLDIESYRRLKPIISANDQFPVFTALNCLIDSNYIFKKQLHTYVFKQLFHCYNSQNNYTLQEIGNVVGLTRERVRQIRQKDFRMLARCFGFLKKLRGNIDCINYIDIQEPIILITKQDANRINTAESTSFSPLFITYILSLVYNKEYVWFGDKNDFIKRKKSNPEKLLNQHYLIHRDIYRIFKMEKFINHLILQIRQPRLEDTTILYPTFLNDFCTIDSRYYSQIETVARKIIETEFEGKIGTTTDYITFYKNKEKGVLNNLIVILLQSDKPLHFKEIHAILSEKGFTYTVQTVHGTLNREPEIFGLKGPGIFGLRSNGGYFGTIGDVAERILSDNKHSIYIEVLLDKVCSELIVSRKSAYSILFNYKNEKRFIRDKNGNVFLKKWLSN